MASPVIDALINFASRVLFIVVNKGFGLDKAYQEAYRKAGKAERKIPPPVLYRIARGVVEKYHTLRFIETRLYGQKSSLKRLSRLWLYYFGTNDEKIVSKLDTELARFRRKFEKSNKNLPSLETLLSSLDDSLEKMAVELSYPLWFVKHVASLVGAKRARTLLEALSREQWWIRVNTLKTDVETVTASLEEKGIIVKRDPDLKYMLKVVDYNEPLHHLEEMWKGEIVFQDKASAMVVEALEPEEGDVVLDMAAAPGIKDSLIMMLTGNKARIIAVDLSWERLKRARRLLKLYEVDIGKIEFVHADAASIQVRPDKVTKILLDAPCTSSGAIGKDPAIKIHLGSKSWVNRFPYLQRLMLRNLQGYIKKGIGVAIYATCSILDLEGEGHVEELGLEDYLERPRLAAASTGYAKYGFSSRVARFFPDLHETQGFFIARLRSR